MHTPDVGDRNIASLLSQAYHPDVPDADFVRRVKGQLRQVAAQSVTHAPREALPLRGLRQRVAWAAGVAALLGCIAVLLHALLHTVPPRPDQVRLATVGPDLSSKYTLTARARPLPPEPARLDVGRELHTDAGQRTRALLPDGSVLYLNQGTEVKVNAERQVTLYRGEVFVEVAPRRAEPFTVRTPHREVVALGTRFDVRAEPAGTGVVVTQGRVKVSGVEAPVQAGQQVVPGGTGLELAPRAAHVLDWTRELVAAAESPLVPGTQFAGGALVAKDPNGQEAKLSLRKFHIDVHVEDGFARTTIDQTYFNHNAARLEGTFYFPLPPDASLSRLAMYVDGVLMEGGMAERQHARNVYETIVYSQRDPALLEWVDGSTFKMRVFPLEGRQEKRIVLSYTQRLDSLYGEVRYRFPAGHTMQLVRDWSFHARVKGAAGKAWTSLNHEMKATKDGADLLLDAALRDAKPDKDVVVELTGKQARADAVHDESVAFASAELDGARYLSVSFRPRLTAGSRYDGLGTGQGRNWVFLVETSGDREPLLARAQIEIVRSLLANAEHDDSFAIISAGACVQTPAPLPRPVTPADVQAGMAFLEQAHLIGALNLGQALEAVAPLVVPGRENYLVHLGTGIGALGERRADVLAKRLPEGVRYVGVGVGKRWGRAFMKDAAERSGGYFTQINPDEPLSWRAFELYSTLHAPRLLDAKVTDPADKVTFLTYTGSLAQGEELCAIARLDAGQAGVPEALTVTGSLNGRPYQHELKVRDVRPGAGYLPRTWAKLEIDRLLAEDAAGNKDKIISLSKAMYVMTPFTSLLVLENEAMYQQYQVDRGRKDHWALYPCPPKIPVVYEPDPTQPVSTPAGAAPKRGEKRPADQVLQTILVRVPPRLLVWPNQQDPLQGQPVVTALHLSHQGYAPAAARIVNGRLGETLSILDDSGVVAGQRGETTYLMLTDEFAAVRSGMINLNTVNGTAFFSLLGRGDVPATREPASVILGDGDNNLFKARSRFAVDFDSAAGDVLSLAREGVLFGTTPGGGGEIAGRFDNYSRGLRLLTTTDLSMPVSADPFFGRKESAGVRDFYGYAGYSEWAEAGGAGGGQLGYFPPARGLVVRGRADQWFFEQERLGDQLESLAAESDGRGSRGWGLQRGLELWERESAEVAPRAGARRARLDAGLRAEGEDRFLARLLARYHRSQRLYQRPNFSGDERVFFDLVSYAPGMNTSPADVRAVLEAEALPRKGDDPGRLDPAAKERIEKARAARWKSVTLPAAGGRPALTVTFDGTGRYAYDRILSLGLRERVVCDGRTLLHLYPELGIGARRDVSRFHRAELARLVPWALPPAADLARVADVTAGPDGVVAVAPRGVAAARDARGNPVAYLCTHLAFAADGRLAERRTVLMPADKVVVREVYDADGTVRVLNADGKELARQSFALRDAAAPELAPDTKGLVVLPLPLRTNEHVRVARDVGNKGYNDLDEETALALFAAAFAQNATEAQHIFERRYHARGQRLLGFYTLLAACGVNVDPDQLYLNVAWQQERPRNLAQGIAGVLPGFQNVLAEHPGEPLARYLAFHSHPQLRQRAHRGEVPGPRDGFIQQLAAFRVLLSHDATTPADHKIELNRALQFVRRHPTSVLSWVLLGKVYDRAGSDEEAYRACADAYRAFESVPSLAYAARYERAHCLYYSNREAQTREQFRSLYTAAARGAGLVPPIDHYLRNSLHDAEKSPDPWADLMRRTAVARVKDGRRDDVVALAWQCHQLGDGPLAEELAATALAGAAEPVEKLQATLAVVDFYQKNNRAARALAVLDLLLHEEPFARVPSLWRLAGQLAAHGGETTARVVPYLEKALDLEFQQLPETIDLRKVRAEYGGLLNHYQQLATAMTTLNVPVPNDFVPRVIRAADRWRALDRDQTAHACQAAARVLKTLKEQELAWDYLTTPVGLKPGESDPWLGVAQSLSAEGELLLADRAYAAAFEAEPTNAQLLWDRAQNLRQAGQKAEAEKVLRQLAEGQWQPRFAWLQSQAKSQLGSR